ncbi:MAG: DNA polymerase V family protein [Candidatus Micrarchaeota archaeon]|nr:DNA polymerase V family protein [Candidatus Micrarchaeota archaeon]
MSLKRDDIKKELSCKQDAELFSIDAFHSQEGREKARRRNPFLKIGVLLGALMISTSCSPSVKGGADRDVFWPQNDTAAQADNVAGSDDAEEESLPDQDLEANEENDSLPDEDVGSDLQDDESADSELAEDDSYAIDDGFVADDNTVDDSIVLDEDMADDNTVDDSVVLDEDMADDNTLDDDNADNEVEEEDEAMPDDDFNTYECSFLGKSPGTSCSFPHSDHYGRTSHSGTGLIPTDKVTHYSERINEFTPSANCDRLLVNAEVRITEKYDSTTYYRWPMDTAWVEAPPYRMLLPTFPDRMLKCFNKPESTCDNYLRRIDPLTADCTNGVNYLMLHARKLYYVAPDYYKVFEGVACTRGSFDFVPAQVGTVFPLLNDPAGRAIRLDSLDINTGTVAVSLLNQNGQVLKSVSHTHNKDRMVLQPSDVERNDMHFEGTDPATGTSFHYVAKNEGFSMILNSLGFCIEEYPWKVYRLNETYQCGSNICNQVKVYDREGRPMYLRFVVESVSEVVTAAYTQAVYLQ